MAPIKSAALTAVGWVLASDTACSCSIASWRTQPNWLPMRLQSRGLPPGVLTIYEDSASMKGTAYVGDARLPALAAGEKRLITYALDSKVNIDRNVSSDSIEGKVAIAGGVIGGVLGNQVGKGSGRSLATIAGVVGGALAGNAVQNGVGGGSVRDVYRVTVQLQDGSMRAVDYQYAPQLSVGDYVRVEGNQIFRR